MKIKEGFVYKKVAGNNLIVPVGKAALNFNAMINLNETGLLIWDCIKDNLTREEIVKKFIDTYDVDKNTASKDVDDFINQLVANGVVEL